VIAHNLECSTSSRDAAASAKSGSEGRQRQLQGKCDARKQADRQQTSTPSYERKTVFHDGEPEAVRLGNGSFPADEDSTFGDGSDIR